MISVCLHAQDDQSSLLNIGDPAPPLRVQEWIKGSPVQKFEKGRIYVLEFWATWCKPCIAAMPHLSAIARQYKDQVTAIGVDIYESHVRPVKSNQKVKAFVDSMGNRMDFTVAIEDSNFTVADWIKATQEENNGIPKTFVVNAEGKLAWIGHPSKLDEVLDKIMNNTWDAHEALIRRNENKRLAILDDSLKFELMRFTRNDFNINDTDKPDSVLLMINEIVRNEPNLKYAPSITSNTFSALLKTDPHAAYEYGKTAIVTPSYDGEPPYDIIISLIDWYSDKLKLTAEIYELGAAAYQTEIDQIPHPELANMPKLYNNMAAMYWRAKNKVKAIDAMQKAIEASKNKKDFPTKDIAAFESRLEQYKNM
jgi:thiol-disulfide isomerase/thioredoxin